MHSGGVWSNGGGTEFGAPPLFDRASAVGVRGVLGGEAAGARHAATARKRSRVFSSSSHLAYFGDKIINLVFFFRQNGKNNITDG